MLRSPKFSHFKRRHPGVPIPSLHFPDVFPSLSKPPRVLQYLFATARLWTLQGRVKDSTSITPLSWIVSRALGSPPSSGKRCWRGPMREAEGVLSLPGASQGPEVCYLDTCTCRITKLADPQAWAL